jgi:hypothetical protein
MSAASPTINVVVPRSTAEAWAHPKSGLRDDERALVKTAKDNQSGPTVTLVVPKSWADRSDKLGQAAQLCVSLQAHGGKSTFGAAAQPPAPAPKPIDPPSVPTAAELKNPKSEKSMPANFVDYNTRMRTGAMHNQWHTTRDFGEIIGELTQTTGPAVLAAWQALRNATPRQGLPAPTPPAGSPPKTLEQTAFVNAMTAFVAANKGSKDQGVQDVLSTWAQVQKNNWPIPEKQEGDPGNGLDFLAMHHVMFSDWKENFANDPVVTTALRGWSHFAAPVAWPYDKTDTAVTEGVPQAQVAVTLCNELLDLDPNDATAVGKFFDDYKNVTNVARENVTLDQFGLWFQSPAGGYSNSGLHDFEHNEYEVPNSPVEMDSFTKNVNNPNFLGLHGTTDAMFVKMAALLNVPFSTLQAEFDEQAKQMNMQPIVSSSPMDMSSMPMSEPADTGPLTVAERLLKEKGRMAPPRH